MLQRPIRTGALAALCLLVSSWAVAGDRALVLSGNDFGLYSVDLTLGAVQQEDAYSGYPGSGAAGGGYYAAVVSGEDRTVLYSAATVAPVAVLEADPGSNPYAAAVDPAYGVFVTCWVSGELVRYDLNGNETGRVATGRSPQGVIVFGDRVYVANAGYRFSDGGYDPGTVMVFDAATLSPLDTVSVGLNPQVLAAAPGEVHALCTGDYFSVFGAVHVIDTGSHAVTDTVVLGGSPGFLALSSTTGFTTDYFGGVYSYDIATGNPEYHAGAPLKPGGGGYTSCAPDDTGHLYVTLYDSDAVAKIDLSTESIVDAYPTGDGPQNIVLVSDAPTPAFLLSFSAQWSGGALTLSWALGDRQPASLRLERDTAQGWQTLAEVPAQGRYVDRHGSGGSLYRLVEVTRDGRLYEVGRLTAPAPVLLAVRAAANPARGSLNLYTSGLERNGTLQLLDVAGRVVSARTVSGNGPITVPAPAAGQYFVRLTGGGRSAVTRVLVLP